MRAVRTWLILALAVVVTAEGQAAARVTSPHATRPLRPAASKPRPVVNVSDTSTLLDGNQVSMFVTNIGSFGFDIPGGASGLEFPRGSNKFAVFAAGIWMGAQVGTETRVTVAEYDMEFVPGPMSGGTFLPDSPRFKVYKVSREDTTGYADWMTNAVPLGAPTDETGLLPGIIGDQTLWTVFNDADIDAHTNDAGFTAPLGVEVQLTAFAFDRQGALGNTVFLKYKLINKGGQTLNNTYLSLWSDPDLGDASDDLVGVDVPAALGYVYNSTNSDAIYGSAPPVVGYDFFKGPTDDLGNVLGLASFNKYVNGTDPSAFDQSYNYMQGLNSDGSPIVNPVTNAVTKYFHDGDPVTNTGWLDTNPGDRRLMQSSGPFTFSPNEEQEVVAALVVGQGRDRLTSITAMRFFDQAAQAAFDADFNLPNPPPQPVVRAVPGDRQVILSWGRESEVPDPEFGYEFEGYNVYQGATAQGPWTRVATFDAVNNRGIIFDLIVDPNSGVVVNAPVQFGSDAGLHYTFIADRDYIRGGALNNGTVYHWAVTGYSFKETGVPKVLEDPFRVQSVIPQKPPLGDDFTAAQPDPIEQIRIDTDISPTNDRVEVVVVDPTQVTGHEYEVFYTIVPPETLVVGADTTIFFAPCGGDSLLAHYWNVRDLTTGQVVLANQTNKSGDENYVVVDGLQIKVIGACTKELLDVFFTNAVPGWGDKLTGGGFGSVPFFHDGAGYADNARPESESSLNPVADPDSFVTVEIRFSGATGPRQKAYRYLREELADGSAPAGLRIYKYGGFHEVPFTVWDTTNDRQIDAMFMEKIVLTANDGTYTPETNDLQYPEYDSTWTPATNAAQGREFVWSTATPYSDTPKPQYEQNAVPIDISPDLPPNYYMSIVALVDEDSVLVEGDKLTFFFGIPGTTNDLLRFQTSPVVRNSVSIAQQGLDRIRVVPNPYYAHSRYENNQFERRIRFMNLPATCTVRIFNLAGNLVRTLRKPDATIDPVYPENNDPSSSVLTWNAETENGLPVASGIYIYHVDIPGVGTTTGRMVVFMEKERLNNF